MWIWMQISLKSTTWKFDANFPRVRLARDFQVVSRSALCERKHNQDGLHFYCLLDLYFISHVYPPLSPLSYQILQAKLCLLPLHYTKYFHCHLSPSSSSSSKKNQKNVFHDAQAPEVYDHTRSWEFYELSALLQWMRSSRCPYRIYWHIGSTLWAHNDRFTF